MYCSNCGTKIDKDSNFCYNCGHKIKDNIGVIIETDEDSSLSEDKYSYKDHLKSEYDNSYKEESFDETIAKQREENQDKNIFEKIFNFFVVEDDYDDEDSLQYDFTKDEYLELIDKNDYKSKDIEGIEDLQEENLDSLIDISYGNINVELTDEKAQEDIVENEIVEVKPSFFEELFSSVESNLNLAKDRLNTFTSSKESTSNIEDIEVEEAEKIDPIKDNILDDTFVVEENPHGDDIELDEDINYEYINVNEDLIVEEDNLFHDIKESLKAFFTSGQESKDSLEDYDYPLEEEQDIESDFTSEKILIENDEVDHSDFADTIIYSKKTLESSLNENEDIQTLEESSQSEVISDLDSKPDNSYEDYSSLENSICSDPIDDSCQPLFIDNEDEAILQDDIIDDVYDRDYLEEYDYSEELSYTKSTVSASDQDDEIVSETKTQKLELEDNKIKIGSSIKESLGSAKDGLSQGLGTLSTKAGNLSSSLGETSKELVFSIKKFFVKNNDTEEEIIDTDKSNIDIQASNMDNTSDTAPLIFTEEEQKILNQAIEEQNRTSYPDKILTALNKRISPIIRNLLSMGSTSRVPMFVAAFALCLISIALNIKKPLALIILSVIKFALSSVTIYLATKYAFNAIRIKLKDSLLSFFIIIQLLIYHLIDLIYIYLTLVPGHELDGIIHVFSPKFFSVLVFIFIGILLLAANYQKMQNKNQALVFIGWYSVIAITITLLLIMLELLVVTAISPVLIEYLNS